MVSQRLRQACSRYRSGERAVSPVIGVILMVAITVILAAVIGAFVMGIGGEQASAPNANLDMGQSTYTVATHHDLSEKYLDTYEDVVHFEVRHGGGETMNQQNIHLQADVEFSDYTGGNITDQLGWLGGLNQSRRDPADQPVDYTTGLWNHRTQRSIEAPETTRYSWWVNDDEDKVMAEYNSVGVDVPGFRDIYQAPGVECTVNAFGQPRNGYVDGDTGLPDSQSFSIWMDQTNTDGDCPLTTGSDMSRVRVDWHEVIVVHGPVGVGDDGRVLWSPPDADQSQTLAEYEIR